MFHLLRFACTHFIKISFMWNRALPFLAPLFSTVMLLLGSICSAEDRAAETFSAVRYREEGKAPIALDTAVVTCTRAPAKADRRELRVDLVGAVHIGSESYYATLNERFTKYDAVLYELIAGPGHQANMREKGNTSLLSRAQLMLTNLLGLTFQLEQINYKAPNFVHADLSPEEFFGSMEKRGESLFKLIVKVLLLSAKEHGKLDASMGPEDPEALLWIALLQPSSAERALVMRRFFARQMKGMDVLLEALAGDGGSTFLSVRNDRALDTLEAEAKKGKRSLAIFYGAAHLPDLRSKLQSRFRMTCTAPEWIEAWDLREAGGTRRVGGD